MHRGYVPEFPHVEIHALTGSFEENALRIDRLATHPFRLVFVDPTGWTGYPLDALKTVCQRRCELILNFMHEHIQRHLYHPSEDRERWLRAIVGDGIAAEFAGRELPAEDIRAAVLRMFKTELRFVYACHSPIEMVEKRRLHFSMIYGTSAEDGVFVLRQAEKKALPDHEWKVKDRRARGQLSMFDDEEHSPGPYGAMRSRHLEDLTALVTELARQTKDAPRTFKSEIPSSCDNCRMAMVLGGSIRFSTAALRSGEYPKSSSYPAHLRNRGKVEQRTTSLTQGANDVEAAKKLSFYIQLRDRGPVSKYLDSLAELLFIALSCDGIGAIAEDVACMDGGSPGVMPKS